MSLRFTLSESASLLIVVKQRVGSHSFGRCPNRAVGDVPGQTREISVSHESAGQGANRQTIGARAAAARRSPGTPPALSRLRGVRTRRAGPGHRRVRLADVLPARLRPGTYVVLLRAYDAAGNRSADISVKFWVLRTNKGGRK